MFSCLHPRLLKCLQYWWFWTWLIFVAHVLEKVIQNPPLLTSLIFMWQVHSTFKVKNSGLTCKIRCKTYTIDHITTNTRVSFSFGLWQNVYQRNSNNNLSCQQIQMINFFIQKYIHWDIPIWIQHGLFRQVDKYIKISFLNAIILELSQIPSLQY